MESDNLIMKKPRREIITYNIILLDDYISTLLQKHWEYASLGTNARLNTAKLTSAVLQLWSKIAGEFRSHRSKEYQEMESTRKRILEKIKKPNVDEVIFFYDKICEFLLDTGVRAFVNSKDYDPMNPTAEDRAKGL